MAPEGCIDRQPKPGKKYFTFEEANRSLPYVSRVVNDLIPCYKHVVDIRRRIEQIHEGDSQEHLEAQYETAMEYLGDLMDELRQVGVELKDFEKGFVDFPAVYTDMETFDEKVIYLCWQYGERSIRFWHETDAGFVGGRQSLDALFNPNGEGFIDDAVTVVNPQKPQTPSPSSGYRGRQPP